MLKMGAMLRRTLWTVCTFTMKFYHANNNLLGDILHFRSKCPHAQSLFIYIKPFLFRALAQV